MGKIKSILTQLIALQGVLLSVPHGGLARGDVIPGSRYTSARAAAMGDAFLPMGEDAASGLFYNPAGLGKIRSLQLEPANFSGYGSTSFFGSLNSNSSKVTSLSDYSSSLQSHSGSLIGVGAALLPNIGSSFVSFGILLQSELAGRANDDGTITYQSLYQIIPAIGKGFQFFKGVLRVGYSLQWVNQASGTVTSSDALPLGYDQGISQGSGFSHNMGVALVVPLSWLPSFNVVARNIGSVHYSSFSIYPIAKNVSAAPGTEPMSLDASFSLHPSLGRGSAWSIVVEGRDLTNQSGAMINKHFAVGTELMLGGRFFLRGGYRGGLPSGGFGLKRPGAEMSLTYYAEEMMTQASQSPSVTDPRIMLQYQFRNF